MTGQLNTNAQIGIQILTPLHVGGADTNHLKLGIDFLYDRDNKLVYLIDKNKLLKELHNKGLLQEYSKRIRDRRRSDLYSFIRKNSISISEITKTSSYTAYDRPNKDIKAFIRSGLDFHPYIPGSSIKGAIRTAILHYLYDGLTQYERKEINKYKLDQELIGTFEKSIMRFIRVYDAHFSNDDLGLYNIDLFNLKGKKRQPNSWFGSYKEEFSITVEALRTSDKAIGNFRLSIADGLLKKIKGKLRNLEQLQERYKIKSFKNNIPSNINTIIKENPIQELFKIINQYTLTHIEREIKFYKKFDDYDRPFEIVDKLIEIQQKIKITKNTCLLRMAFGTGFHGMSGDWRYEDHTKTGFWTERENRKHVGKLRYKSRKIAEYDPMGFVKLSIIK